MRATAFAILVVIFGLGATAHAQTKPAGPPLTDNNFNLDLVTGPVLGSGRVIGLSGAYTALATGIGGAPWNPASYANRTLWSTNWFSWDVSANIVPTLLRRADFENNGQPGGYTYGDFVFGTVGLGLEFGEFGVGGLINLHSYHLGDTADLSLATANYGAGYMFADGQLVVGAGARTAILQISDRMTKSTLVDVGGTSPEVGGLLQLANQPFRVGVAARAPVVSGRLGSLEAAGKTLPRQIHLPWEFQTGFSFQLGSRPLNRKWVNPHDVEARLRKEMLERRKARAREQLAQEMLAAKMERADGRAPPSLPELEKNPQIVPDYLPQDRSWWADETKRRWEEERELLAELAEAAAARDAAVRELSRRYILFVTETILTGPTTNGVGLESFLSQVRQGSGRHVTAGFRFGIEGEPIASWVQMRAGTYFEPSRFDNVGYRVHGTLGTDVRLFSWNLFGLLDEFTLSVGASADVAERYLNVGFGVGLWH